MARSTNTPKKARKPAKAAQSAKHKRPGQPHVAEESKSYIGRRVSKNFDGEIYSGTVAKYNSKYRLWKIDYDDGDAEEMDWHDLSNAMDLFDWRSKKKGKKKRKSGTSKASPAKAQDAKPEPVASSAVASPAAAKNFRVVRTTYPSNGSNSSREEDVVGEYATREQANEAAWNEMNTTSQFEDWGEKHFSGKSPPYSSADGPFEAIADEDEFVDISVVDIAKEEAEKKRQLEEAKASKPPAKKAKLPDPAQRVFGQTNDEIVVDANLFARNPCRIPGGTGRHPSAYPNFHKGKGSFGFLIQRLSDRNYAMRALCLDGHGAKYNTYKKKGVNYISVVWYPPTNLNDHVNDETILDGCHLDLIDPDDGRTYLTSPILEEAIDGAKEKVECLFLNGAESNRHSVISAEDIASAILKCSRSLKCVSLTECKLNSTLVSALATCPNLRGIIVENCQLWGEGDDRPTDAGVAKVLRSCPDLRWCFVKSSLFSKECWEALAADGGCPKLEMLWVDAPTHTDDRVNAARGNHDTIRAALDKRAGTLRLCMINPDSENKSRYVIGGAKETDRLNGRERTEEEKQALKLMQSFSKSSYVDAV